MIKGRISSLSVKQNITPVQVLGSYDLHEFTPEPQKVDLELYLSEPYSGPSIMTGLRDEIVILTKDEYDALLVNKVMMTE